MLKKIHRIQIKMKLLSGMHITGSDDTFDIGGPDSQVIKNPLTGEPYIPGSSLKGKLRSLLEYKYGTIDLTKEELSIRDENELCLALFEPREKLLPNITRGIFRDLVLTEESKKQLCETFGEGIYTEIKAENKINRIKGKAANPRFIERVPAGCEFVGEIDIMEFDGDKIDRLKGYLEEALQLLQHNFIGGSGSRGYGRVSVNFIELDDE